MIEILRRFKNKLKKYAGKISVDCHVFNLQPLTIENLRNRMKRFNIHNIEYRPKRVWFPRHVRKALKAAFIDAVTGASALTLLYAGCML